MTNDQQRSYSVNCRGTEPALVRGQDFSLDDSGLRSVLSTDLTPRLADLLDIALATYVVDRSQRRPGAHQTATGRSWGRPMCLRIGVRDAPFWVEASASLIELLHGLTDDDWHFEFTAFTGPPFSSEVEAPFSISLADADCVALFSGGLDSLAGALTAFAAGRSPLLVSIETNSRMAATQRSLKRNLRRHWPHMMTASAAVELHGGDSPEPSQRGRAFLFLALAGVVAAGSGLDRVEVYENGVGAIALPYLANQEGAHTTKAMHPETLARCAALVGVVAGTPIEYVNPSLWSTKAELCSGVPRELRYLIPESESCDTAFAYRGEGVHRCGACTSCLLRRQALWAAGLQHLDALQPVRTDLIAGAWTGEPRTDASLLSMLDQSERIGAALTDDAPWGALTRRFPELLDAARSPDERGACLSLYARYVDEWRCFPSPLVDRYLLRQSGERPSSQGHRRHG